MAPRGVGGARRISGAGSGGALRMSPRRSIEICTCWKSCQICDSRRIGCTACDGDHVEGDKRPDAEFAVDHRLGAEQQQRGGGELADILNGELPARAEHGRGEARLHIGRELFLPLRAHHRFDRRRLDRADADDRLDQELLARRAPVEFLVHQIAQRRPDEEADQNVDGQAEQNDQRQAQRIGEHHRRRRRRRRRGRSPKTAPAQSGSVRIVSSSRTRATVCPAERVSK